MERSIRVVAWVWRKSVSFTCVAECCVVLWRIERKLFIVQEWTTARVCPYAWIHGADIPLADVSSMVDSGWVGTALFTQADTAVDESCDRGGWSAIME